MHISRLWATGLFTTKTKIYICEMSYHNQQKLHPLLRYDLDALCGGIQLIKLEYLEAETTRAPVPRNQDVPEEAFGVLTGRSILVATSHAWFYQCHPDPQGVKLNIMRKQFFPRLRKRFPHTQILVFDDWHSIPQWPRNTKEENERFQKCLDHMHSIYCYCDVVLFVETPLPKQDDTILKCDLVPSEHNWLAFIDTIHYIRGQDNKDAVAIQKNDIIVGVKGVKQPITLELLQEMKKITTISYLRRPYGKPNRTPTEERGWLYSERITVAIRMAAAKPESFDDVVMTNDEMMLTTIYTWTEALRVAVRLEKSKGKGALRVTLNAFEAVLYRMNFTVPSDTRVVRNIMHDVVNRFKNNWKDETKRQDDMAKRAREILLRWGCFSEEYVERAELLCDVEGNKDRKSWLLLSVIVGVVAPMFAVLPFVVALEDNGEDPSRDELVVSTVWLGGSCSVLAVILLHALNLAFAKIPIGGHTVCAWVLVSFVCVSLSLLLRAVFKTIVPFEAINVGILSFIFTDVLFGMVKFIPVKNKVTGQTKRWAVGMATLTLSPSLFQFSLQYT